MARNKHKNRNQDQEDQNESQAPDGGVSRSLEEKIEDFALTYTKEIGIGISVIAILIIGYIGYNQFILGPMQEEAKEEIFRAQWHFENNAYENALYGVEGESPGFIDIAEEYGRTKTGNLANYYVGVISLELGEYEQAKRYFNNFKTESKMLGPLRLGGLGDAHSQLGAYDRAADYYMRAARKEDNPMTSPVFFKKAGLAYEETGNYSKALEAYNAVNENYQDSEAAADIPKYISRVERKQESQDL